MKLKFSGARAPANLQVIQRALNSIPDERSVVLERNSGVFFLEFDENHSGQTAITSMPLVALWLNDPASAPILEQAVNRFVAALGNTENPPGAS